MNIDRLMLITGQGICPDQSHCRYVHFDKHTPADCKRLLFCLSPHRYWCVNVRKSMRQYGCQLLICPARWQMHCSTQNLYDEGQQLSMWEDDVLPLQCVLLQTEVMHLVKLLCLEQFAIIHYLPKIIHALPHKIFIGRRDLRP